MYIEIKKNPEKTGKFPESEEITDRNGIPITRPEVIAEYKRIKSIPHSQRTAKEGIRLNNILKHGDKCPNKNKMRTVSPAEPAEPRLDALNAIVEQNQNTQCSELIVESIINEIYNGTNPIQAILKNNVTPQKFYRILEKPAFSEKKVEYYHARECYAEFCLYKRELLEKQLLDGEIDSSTYATLSTDYKYLASKFYPKVYGDKINIESNVVTAVTHTVDNNRIIQLNQMLSGGLLEDKRAVDADFEEVD